MISSYRHPSSLAIAYSGAKSTIASKAHSRILRGTYLGIRKNIYHATVNARSKMTETKGLNINIKTPLSGGFAVQFTQRVHGYSTLTSLKTVESESDVANITNTHVIGQQSDYTNKTIEILKSTTDAIKGYGRNVDHEFDFLISEFLKRAAYIEESKTNNVVSVLTVGKPSSQVKLDELMIGIEQSLDTQDLGFDIKHINTEERSLLNETEYLNILKSNKVVVYCEDVEQLFTPANRELVEKVIVHARCDTEFIIEHEDEALKFQDQDEVSRYKKIIKLGLGIPGIKLRLSHKSAIVEHFLSIFKEKTIDKDREEYINIMTLCSDYLVKAKAINRILGNKKEKTHMLVEKYENSMKGSIGRFELRLSSILDEDKSVIKARLNNWENKKYIWRSLLGRVDGVYEEFVLLLAQNILLRTEIQTIYEAGRLSKGLLSNKAMFEKDLSVIDDIAKNAMDQHGIHGVVSPTSSITPNKIPFTDEKTPDTYFLTKHVWRFKSGFAENNYLSEGLINDIRLSVVKFYSISAIGSTASFALSFSTFDLPLVYSGFGSLLSVIIAFVTAKSSFSRVFAKSRNFIEDKFSNLKSNITDEYSKLLFKK